MDIFVEQIVRKAKSSKDTVLKLLTSIGVGLVAVICLLFIPIPINFMLVIGAFYGGFFLLSNFDWEYEYIVTNGELDIDKIIAKRKRKRLLTVKANAFDNYGLLKNAPKIESGVTVVQADGATSNESYFADFKHSSLGNVRLIFSPDEKVLEAIKPYLSHTIRYNLNK